ncbi:MAG: hypothetical protein JW770_08125 [Actinobacteria bacterium]|nr:hypothetical protein [Actinomycetota bacterium]
MRKLPVFLLVVFIIVFLSTSSLWAQESERQGDSSFSTRLNDDIYVFGSDISITEDVAGDLVMAGGRIDVDGNTAQDLMVAGGMITINGDVMDDIRAAGGVISIAGNVADNLLAVGGQISISKEAVVGGALVISGQTINISGAVENNATLSGGDITISGKIDGDVKIEGVENLKVTSSAEITGDLIYSSANRADISGDAIIGGEVEETIVKKAEPGKLKAGAERTAWAIFTASYIGGRIINFLGLFVLGIILILAMPGFFQKFNDRMKHAPGYCVGGGAIVLFGVPIVSLVVFIITILLFITIIGSGAGIVAIASNVIMLIVYGLLIYLSTIFLSYFLGRTILSKTTLNMEKYGWRVLAYLIGLVIIMIVYSIPFAGWVIRFAGILFGLGGISLVLKDLMVKACRKK